MHEHPYLWTQLCARDCGCREIYDGDGGVADRGGAPGKCGIVLIPIIRLGRCFPDIVRGHTDVNGSITSMSSAVRSMFPESRPVYAGCCIWQVLFCRALQLCSVKLFAVLMSASLSRRPSVWFRSRYITCAPVTSSLCGCTSRILRSEMAYHLGLAAPQTYEAGDGPSSRLCSIGIANGFRQSPTAWMVYARPRVSRADKRIVFPNWVDPEVIQPLESDFRTYSRGLICPITQFVVLFSGTIARKHDIDVLIAAAKKCADDRDIHFVICGEGAGRSRVEPEDRRIVQCDPDTPPAVRTSQQPA